MVRTSLVAGVPPEIMATHGENECHSDEGGPRCYYTQAPKGLAYFERSPLGASNTFNDVRPEGSPRKLTWQTIALKHAKVTNATQRISMQYIMTAAWGDMAPRNTYNLRGDLDSVVWDTGAVVGSPLSVVEAYMHSHQHLLYDIWWFHGTPEAVFDDLEIARRSQGRLDDSPHIFNTTMANIRARQLKPNPAPLACSYMTHRRTEWVDVEGHPEEFSRKVRCPVSGGFTDYVIIAFHRKKTTEIKRMHAYVKLYYATSGVEMLSENSHLEYTPSYAYGG